MAELASLLAGIVGDAHVLGVAKQRYFLELTDPVKIGLMRRIMQAFDPEGILNPGVLLGAPGPGDDGQPDSGMNRAHE